MTKLLAALVQGVPGSPCCCAPPPSGVLSYQTCGGTATLCGYSEYTSPSTPPKKYRQQSLSGFIIACQGGASCSNAYARDNYGGAYTFDATTCAGTNGQTGQHADDSGTVRPCGSGSGTLVPYTPAMVFPGPDSYGALSYTYTLGRITQTWIPSPACGSPNSPNFTGSGGVNCGLSNEDTEDQAISRAACSYTACSGAESDCSAYKVLRGAGVFTLTYRSAQVKVTSTGNVYGQLYEITINLQRRVQGSGGAFVDWATITDEYTGPMSDPYVSPWYSIPCDSGYEVAANAVSIVAI